MSESPAPPLPAASPEQRRIAATNYQKAQAVAAEGGFDYAISLLLTSCKLEPLNLVYRQTIRKTQKAKYGEAMRGSRFSFLSNSGSVTKLKLAKQQGRWLQVLELGEEVFGKNPWDLGNALDMADAFVALGAPDLAIFELDQARQKYPKDAHLNRTLARLFEKRGNFPQAIMLWQLVKAADPTDTEAASKAKDLAASETIQRGQYSGEPVAEGEEGPRYLRNEANRPAAGDAPATPADRLSREAAPIQTQLAARPNDPSLYIKLAGVYTKYGHPERARATLQRGLAATGNDPLVALELLETELVPLRKTLTDVEAKLARREKGGLDAADEDHTLEELKAMRLEALREILRREIDIFRAKADRSPTDGAPRIELGVRLLRGGRIDDAITELQKARKDNRVAWRALFHLGMCFKKRDNWRLAQRNLDEALAAAPAGDEDARKQILYQLATGHAEHNALATAIDLGQELANLDFGYRQIGQLLDEWEERQRAEKD